VKLSACGGVTRYPSDTGTLRSFLKIAETGSIKAAPRYRSACPGVFEPTAAATRG